MKGRTSDVVTAKTRKTADQNEHFDTLPLLSPPEILQVEEEQGRCFDDEGNHDALEEGSGAACCRICLESESLTPGDELIAPCMCKGTHQFVHRDCLDHWRSVKEGFAFSHCTTCKAQFHLRLELPEDYSWRQLKFKFFVTRDIFLVFLVLQTVRKSHSYLSWFALPWQVPSIPTINFSVFAFFVVMGVAGIFIHCWSIGRHGQCADGCGGSFPCYGWDCFPASMEAFGVFVIMFVIIFAILGFFYCMLAATMAIQRIWQNHYHVLTKHILTKEYIVEDLHGNYVPPTLAAEHVNRLHSLNLL
ncbi:unnamed protein product [Sphagnum troendelagicum]|uniref:RING-CH-type domain-containing protein n=1 Tax=Sphagnum troendelagicum TaxID=128251 RepID=A0ABP0UB10_9BRYO